MSKVLIVILLFIALLLPGLALADAQAVTSTDLIERAKELDGQEVMYTGEVIGDIMKNREHTWLNVSDGTNAMGIWAANDAIQSVTLPGQYDQHGDTLQVTGVFHRACREHGGDMDIHLSSVSLLERGYAVTHAVDRQRVILALVLVSSCAGLIALLSRSLRKNN